MNPYTKSKRIERISIAALFVLIIWAIATSELPDRKLDYATHTWRFLSRFVPPDFSDFNHIISGLLETIRMASIATLFGVLVSIPLALGVSRVNPSHIVRSSVSLILNAIRTIPSLIWALMAVAVVGPHMLAGIVALTIYSTGYLAKFFSDVINGNSRQVFRHLMATGAHPIQAFQYGLWPSIKSVLVSQSLWMLEYNIRSAAIIGYVGAGGLGTLLYQYQEYAQWNRFSAVLIVIFAIVTSLDLWNSSLRSASQVERE